MYLSPTHSVAFGITALKASRELRQHGWKSVRQNGTSHRLFQRGNTIFSLPIHNGDLSPGIANKIKKLTK